MQRARLPPSRASACDRPLHPHLQHKEHESIRLADPNAPPVPSLLRDVAPLKEEPTRCTGAWGVAVTEPQGVCQVTWEPWFPSPSSGEPRLSSTWSDRAYARAACHVCRQGLHRVPRGCPKALCPRALAMLQSMQLVSTSRWVWWRTCAQQLPVCPDPARSSSRGTVSWLCSKACRGCLVARL